MLRGLLSVQICSPASEVRNELAKKRIRKRNHQWQIGGVKVKATMDSVIGYSFIYIVGFVLIVIGGKKAIAFHCNQK